MQKLLNSLGFIILNPEGNPMALRTTVRTISNHFQTSSCLCVVGKQEDISENSKHSKTIQGGNTVTSFIDAGLEESRTDWCMMISAGTFLRSTSLKKFEYFQREDKDILYPVVDRLYAFDEASINGLIIPRIAYKEVGKFGDNNHSIQLVKMLWGLQAINKGYKFKAIVGSRLV